MDSEGRPGVADLRRYYADVGLSESALSDDPFTQFGAWLDDAVRAEVVEPNAMVLATADEHGRPSARTVLLKGFDARGFVFFTNLGSRKGREATANPYAALTFPWFPLERQVGVRGSVERVSAEESEAYFRSRPHASRVGAWASRQSAELTDRVELDARYARLHARWPEGTEVPVPDFWGGLRVVPATVEFWQGRPSRLHDRLEYRLDPAAASGWRVVRLSP